MSIPASTHAIKIQGPGKASVTESKTPALRDDYILVNVAAVALNPTDWKHIDFLAPVGSTVGCDYAGTVLAVGPKVSKQFKVGDRVWGMTHGANAIQAEDGAFGQIIAAKGDVQQLTPQNLSNEEAATLGVGIFTVGQALYQSLGLPLPGKSTPENEGKTVLIYGGSTATGALAIQFAKQSGFKVIATASPRSFDYVKSLGADHVFDYSSATVSADIRAASNNSIEHVLDCISEGNSLKICAESFSPKGGIYSALLGVDNSILTSVNPNIQVKGTLAYTTFGEPVKKLAWGIDYPASAADFEFAKSFGELANRLLAEGKVKVHKPTVNEGGSGLEGVLKGLQLFREGKVRGTKLVYTL
ncbi:alcohol dehydrogenase class-3 [Chytriomyces cf. hyalinus JEL632]|nr:alcohol dehydrogenase class-3 [Chytriomyces cf. hyalinus JEL632]